MPAEVFARTGNTAFDRTGAETESLGNFLVRVIQEIAQRKNLTLTRAELSHARRDVCEKLSICLFSRGIGNIAGDEVCKGRIAVITKRAIKRAGFVTVTAEKITVTIA
jgi:hypothetical protein